MKERALSQIKAILDHTPLTKFKATVDELCKNGVGRGCFQDYVVLSDVISLLSYCESYIACEKNQ